MIADTLRDFCPAFACLYYAAGCILAARMFHRDRHDDIGRISVRVIGWPPVVFVLFAAAFWPLFLAMLGFGRYAVRCERRRLQRVLSCR